jgi:hypothetical protein
LLVRTEGPDGPNRKAMRLAIDRIATLEAALREITMLEIGTPLQDARIICRKALDEPPGLIGTFHPDGWPDVPEGAV